MITIAISAISAVSVLAALAAPPAADLDPVSGMRGANYVPSYARNDVQTWMDFDPAVIDRELGYAERLRLDTVRVFLQFAVWEQDPKAFLERFEKFLELCGKHRIRAMPVVFDSCFGDFPDLERYRDLDWMACPGQHRLGKEHWPVLERYVRDVCGGHRGDRRISMWDVCNEPTSTSFSSDADKERIWTFLDRFLDAVGEADPTHPRCVGVEHSSLIPKVLGKVEVLATHNYREDLREDIRAVKELGRAQGKPVIVNEVVMRPGQTFAFAMPILAEEKVGWCFWELMLGRTQFSRGEEPIQGVLYPDGTCRDAAEVAAILEPGRPAAEARRIAAAAGFTQRRWTRDEAWSWYRKLPWIVGFNFVPSTAANTTELWQAETFDEAAIDRELGLAAGAGFNALRVFLQYLVWKQDPEGLKARFARLLEIADRRGISVIPALFDDCAFGDPPQTEPYLGKQRDLVPGILGPSWTPSPGLKAVEDRSAWPDLERYLRDLVGTFGADRRVLFWDLYNEPGNSGMENRSLPLVEAAFGWARAADPRQPITAGIWSGMDDLNRVMMERSDIITFHAYMKGDDLRSAIARHKLARRPVVCTEWMARLLGSRWETDLPLFKREGVGCLSWGLVNGRMQCQFPWWSKRGDPEPEVWFHDLFRRDGSPWDLREVEFIRRTAAAKLLDHDRVDYSRPRPAPGEIADTDPIFRWSGPWTAWQGEGPPWGTLHYANRAGDAVEIDVEGREIILLHKVGPDCGIAEVSVDGKAPMALDTYGKDVEWCRRTPVARDLPPGKHRLRIVVTGRKDPASSDHYVQVVGIEVRGREPASAALPLRKILDVPLRDTSICRGPDGAYYMTGTVEPFWGFNEGIRLWRSRDLAAWEPLGMVWKYGASPWHEKYLTARKPLWAPEVHWMKGTFWLTYSIPGWDGTGRTSGSGLLRSVSGLPEGPYEDVQPAERMGDEIDASLFEDDDGTVYFLWHSGKIARMKPDMSGLAEPYRWLKSTASDPDPRHHSGLCAGIFGAGSFDHVGYEGMFLFKAGGRYYLSCAEAFEGRYSCTIASSESLFGPYGPRYEALPHVGHNAFFRDDRGRWWSTYFGSDPGAPWQERPGILPVEVGPDGRIRPKIP